MSDHSADERAALVIPSRRWVGVGVGVQVCERVASVAVRSDRRKENKGTIHSAGDHREVAMHHAANTLSTHALWCAANAHRCCVCDVDVSPLRSHKYIHLQHVRPITWPLFNHLDVGPPLSWRAITSYSTPLPVSERGLISFTPFGIGGEQRDRAGIRSRRINVTIALRIGIESN